MHCGTLLRGVLIVLELSRELSVMLKGLGIQQPLADKMPIKL